ncbi:MAG: hypothetical protein ACW964_04305 [Candidatus Hodarchaeales archaeon]
MSCVSIYRSKNKKGYYTKLVCISVVVAVLMAVPFVQAYSTPSMTPLIVNMDPSSPETQVTVTELQKETRAVTVNYKSLQYNIETLRTHSLIIFVGHGNSKGIHTEKEVVGYQELLMNIAPVNIFAACYSHEATKLSTKKTILGFKGQIDGILAANSISYFIGKSAPHFAKNNNTPERAAKNIIHRLGALEDGQPELSLRYELDSGEGGSTSSSSSSSSTPYMSSEEWLWFGLSLIITVCVQALLIWGVSWVIARYGQRFVSALGNAFSKIFRRGASEVSFLSQILQKTISGVTIASIANWASLILRILYSGVTKVVEAVINTANWLDWIVVGVSIAASIYAIFQTGTTSLVVGLGIAAFPIYKVIMNGIKNYIDPDGIWNQYYFAWFKILMMY